MPETMVARRPRRLPCWATWMTGQLTLQRVDAGQLAVEPQPAGEAEVAEERHVVAGHEERAR